MVLEIDFCTRLLIWWLLHSLKAKTMHSESYRPHFALIFNSLCFPYTVLFCDKIQIIHLELVSVSPSQGPERLLHQNIGHRLGSFLLKYKVRHSKVWSLCPCIRLTISTPWCWPWISSDVSSSVPLWSASLAASALIIMHTLQVCLCLLCLNHTKTQNTRVKNAVKLAPYHWNPF